MKLPYTKKQRAGNLPFFHNEKYFHMIILLLTNVFFSFMALSYLISFGYQNTSNVFIIFIVVFPILNLFLSMKGLTIISKKIKKSLLKKECEIKEIGAYLFYSLIPFSVGGIISIILIFKYEKLLSLAREAERFTEYSLYVRQIPAIHTTAIYAISILAVILSFSILILLLLRNKCGFKNSLAISLCSVLYLCGLFFLIIAAVFIISFTVFTMINLSGGAPFGP